MMDASHAELLLKGAAQAAPDVPAMGIHARPAAMSKKGYMVRYRAYEMYALVSWHCAGLLFQLQAHEMRSSADLTWYRDQRQLQRSSQTPPVVQVVSENMSAELAQYFEKLPTSVEEAVNSYDFSTGTFTRYRLRPHIAPELMSLHPQQLRLALF